MNGPAAPWAAIVVAGGLGRRMGGRDKPAMTIDGRSLLAIALDAVAGARRIVVVGPRRPVADGGTAVTWTREHPVGGGPAAALAAGVRALAADPAVPAGPAPARPAVPAGALVAVLAADLPAITPGTVARLAAAVRPAAPSGGATPDRTGPGPVGGGDGALLVDENGRRQLLAGVWRFDRLRAAVGMRADWRGAALRDLLAPLRAVEVAAAGAEGADLDTPDDARRWHAR